MGNAGPPERTLSTVYDGRSGSGASSGAAPARDDDGDRAGAPDRAHDHASTLLAPAGGAAPDAAAPRALRPGDRIGRYVVEEILGQGGMGVVVAARDPGLSRAVALKVVRPDLGDRSYRARLVREARAMAQLEHPHVVRVYDAGDEGGEIFVAMELIRGETLGRWLGAGARPWREVLARFLAAGRGLAAAHAAGLVHRDFKPDNVLVRSSDGQVCVTDFGLAIPALEPPEPPAATPPMEVSAVDATAPQPAPGITRTGAAIGTPAYMAPEQHRGESCDARADVYGFCASLYEGLYGQRPFAIEGAGPVAYLTAIEGGAVRPPPPGRTVPRALHRAVVRGLAFAPAARWQTMDELLGALERAARSRGRTAALALGGVAIAAGGATALALATRHAGDDGARATDALAAAARDAGATTTPAPPSDAGAAEPAPPPLAPVAELAAARPLTALGRCAESPAYVDDHTIVFTFDGERSVDLWTVDDRGFDARALTRDVATSEWRPAPGRRPGEVVYLETTPDQQRSQIVARDVATGAETARVDTYAFAVAGRGDAFYYVANHATEIRRRAGMRDEAFLSLPTGLDAEQLALAPTSDRVAFIVSFDPAQPYRMCTLAPAQPPRCTPGVTTGRPAFGADGRAVYFGTRAGVVRRGADDDQLERVVPGRPVSLGVAVSPDGGRLVYSDCAALRSLVDATAAGVDAAPLDDGAALDPAAGPGGQLAWVRQRDGRTSIALRRGDGAVVEVVPPGFGELHAPAFDHRGERLVFKSSGAHVGLFSVDLTRDHAIYQLTDGATDAGPLWTRDGKVVFRRTGEGNLAHVFVVDAIGGAAQQALPANTTPLTADLATGRILLATLDGNAMWWDPVTGKRGAQLTAPTDTADVRVSPGGKWLLFVRGADGVTLSRAPADHPTELSPVTTLGPDFSQNGATILDDGRVIVALTRWRGELILVPARAGARY